MDEFNMDMVPDQRDRIAIVTGANSGLGYETALALAKKKMKVIMACRNEARAEQSKEKIIAEVPNADVQIMMVDLKSLQSVRTFANQFLEKYTRLDLLINNAGIMMPPFELTEDGFESQMAINYFSHFALTGLLLPRLQNTPQSRVVMMSSIAHRGGYINLDDIHSKAKYSPMGAYARSKLACLMFAYELQRRLDAQGIASPLSVACHPGIAVTQLQQSLPAFLRVLFGVLIVFVAKHSAARGAESTLYAALGANVKGGEYFGPGGKMEFKGAATKVDSTPRSKEVETAQQLWKLSEELTGVQLRVRR